MKQRFLFIKGTFAYFYLSEKERELRMCLSGKER
ncbi:hypothetical protein predicted by Glimmer/Critica [Bacteroides ovatus V975]|jgi:hypothetical protein|nr:hypothetical protein predicted by Glimmer/Critica [Bacteroides ovatus V975]